MPSRARALALLALAASCVAACGGSTEPTTNAPTIHLSASQAAVLSSRVHAVAASHPELAWLADSASLVLTSGAEADRIDLTTDLAAGPFYAVGLQRAIVTTTSSYGTFDFIAFDSPSNPSNFVLVDGYMAGAGTTAPRQVIGPFGAALHGYLFRVAGNTVTTWSAQSGGASLATGTAGGACVGFQSQAGISCAQSALQASFSMTTTSTDSAGSAHTASLATTNVAGILLTFQ